MSYLEDTTAYIINYNSAQVIETCLKNLSGVSEIIIVDNASTDDSLARAEAFNSGIKIIRNSENHGYGVAANQALAQVKTPYALAVNPDAEINAEAISKLVRGMIDYPNAIVTAPYLLSPDRGLILRVKGPHEKMHGPLSVIPEGPFSTWSITGAVWLCRMSAWRDVGGYDENIFLYCEDYDLCRRATSKGYTLVYIPDSQGTHLVNQATIPTRRIRWRKEWNMTWSELYLAEKYEGTAKGRSEGFRKLRQHGLKALFYALVLDQKRLLRDLPAALAALRFLRGGKPTRGL